MNRELIRHMTSGDVSVAEIDDADSIHARPLPLAAHDYSSEGECLPNLDLYEFQVDWPEDEPFSGGEYGAIAIQDAGQAHLRVIGPA